MNLGGFEIGSYLLGAEYLNEIGLAGGIATGLAYAVHHTFTQDHGGFGRALGYALTAETACVLGATTAEYVATTYSSSPIPYSLETLKWALYGCPLLLVSA